MTREAHWYFDFISPYSYLQLGSFDRLPAGLKLRPVPVLFAGLLNHWGNTGPAEIPAKRRQMYRYCHWLAEKRGMPFKLPPRHPFNPLTLLRLAIALDGDLDVVRTIFHHVWGEGNDGQHEDSLHALATKLGVKNMEALTSDPVVKAKLRQNTEDAIEKGVFGVPAFLIDGEIFWGEDITDMLIDYLKDPGLFTRGEQERIAELPMAAWRKGKKPDGQ